MQLLVCAVTVCELVRLPSSVARYKDNADGNGFNTSVQPYAMVVHRDSSRRAAEEAFLRFAGNAMDAKFCKGRFVHNAAKQPLGSVR